ncbi:patatin-like phospholipase family protein [Candidatus Odyssella acanthamoebae]|uniref:PNPLA domain-containing protein n=1 Tax=Candidatus Odyssella acanthamoebae TaxID=91604 RepID=A0A077ASX9_9PROT|nr:patatin-like phospholipase family protein [Candidatus Paracaedibacter acanthamoebae]AIK96312.1 hypothetical protein ID47_05530 [Candidatus Paracaedibacter acanthamoebae]
MLYHQQPTSLLKKIANSWYALILPMILFSLSARAMEKDENIPIYSSVPPYAADNMGSNLNPPNIGLPQPLVGFLPVIEEDDTIFSPTEASSQILLEDEKLPISHRLMQSYGDEEIAPKFGLALDGGGFRGYMEALWLKAFKEELESDTSEDNFTGPLSEVFDCIGGTSIGGILSLGIASNIEPDELVALFEEHGNSIFPKGSWCARLKNLGGVIGSKYQPQPLEGLLQAKFGDNTLKDAATPVLVTACTTTGKPKLFKSFFADDQGHKLWEVARSTSAAPTYFPSYKLTTHTDFFVDGGIWNNNPATLVAASMVKELHGGTFSPNNLYVLSLGTGDMSLHTTLSTDAGLFSARNIIELLMSTSSRGNHETMQTFLGETYYRVNPLITQKIDLAATDKETIRILKASAEHDLPMGVIKNFAKKFLELRRG